MNPRDPSPQQYEEAAERDEQHEREMHDERRVGEQSIHHAATRATRKNVTKLSSRSDRQKT
jgi:hypothetical protein